MRPANDITDSRVVKALAHPMRVRILDLLDDNTASPSEIAEIIDAPLTHVSYHVRRLASLGLIKLVRKTPRRGAVEHHYRAVSRPKITDHAWAGVPNIVKGAMIGAALEQAGSYLAAGAAEGGFNRDDAHTSRTTLDVDAQGWRELSELLATTLERIKQIQAESTKRLSTDESVERERATAMIMLFEGPYEPVPGESEREKGRARTTRSSAG